MTKNVATKWWRRRTGSTWLNWPADASSKVRSTGFEGQRRAPRAVRAQLLAPRRVVAGVGERLHLAGECPRRDDVGPRARAVQGAQRPDLVVAEHRDVRARGHRGDVGARHGRP